MLTFGWVSNQIQSNWADWSWWKSTGDDTDAQQFYDHTADKAYTQHLTWFCYQIY